MSGEYRLSLAEAATAIERRELTAVDLVTATLERCESVGSRTGAFTQLLAEEALDAARVAEREIAHGRYRGPLHGIPVAIKEVIDVAGIVTTAGLTASDAAPATADAPVVAALREAGAVVIGATRSHELAFGVMTPGTSNPWDLDRTCGGSSGGSAAAVAAGQATFALGTDTGGSVRGPAAACGIVGVRPTFGRISTRGALANSRSLDTVGPLTRTVEDAALSLGPLTGVDHASAAEQPIRGLRIGIPTAYFFDHVEPEVADAVLRAGDVLAGEGATLVEVDAPYHEAFMAIVLGIQAPEIAAEHARLLRERGELLTRDSRVTLEAASLLPATSYVKARRARRLLMEAWQQVFERVDVVLAPTYPVGAVRAGQRTVRWPDGYEEPVWEAYSRLTVPASLLGAPTVSVPCGAAANGLPCGMQIIGRPFAEDVILAVAGAYDRTGEGRIAAPPGALVVEHSKGARTCNEHPVRALDGIRVVDLTEVMAGPFCTHAARRHGRRRRQGRGAGRGDRSRRDGLRSPRAARAAPSSPSTATSAASCST